MKNGDIIEKGTHQELLQAPTLYASLYNSQFQTIKELEQVILLLTRSSSFIAKY